MDTSRLDDIDAAIIGGGMAGLSASVFLARAGVRTALFDDGESSLRRVMRVNNYVGFPDGIGGVELIERGRRQAENCGVLFFEDRVEAITPSGNGFIVRAGANTRACSYVVLASNKRVDLALALGLTLGGHGGRFVAVDAQGQTAVSGCYAAGRITGAPSQAIIAAGDGARVAIGLIERIRGAYYVDHDT